MMIGLAAAVVVISGLRASADLVGPAFLAMVLVICVHPVRAWMKSKGVPGWLASLVAGLVVYGILIGLAVSLVVATARFATLLPTYADQFNDLVDDGVTWLESVGVDQDQINKMLHSVDISQLNGLIADLLGSVAGVVGNLVFILTLLLFLTMDAGTFPLNLESTREFRGRVVEALSAFATGTRTYFVVSTIFGFIVAVLDTIALQLLGVPVPLLWGLLAFITNYIPNIGFVIGVIPPAILGLLEGGPSLMIAVIVVYSLLNLVIQTIIQPKFVGDAVGLSTSLTFLSLVFWAWVLGPLGALLAIPLSLFAKALLVDVDPDSRWLTPLLSNPGPEKPAKPGKGSRRSRPTEVAPSADDAATADPA